MRNEDKRFEIGKIYTATDSAAIMHMAREMVTQVRESGLFPMYKTGKGWYIEGSQAIRTLQWWAEEGFDLSSPEAIILAGQRVRRRNDTAKR